MTKSMNKTDLVRHLAKETGATHVLVAELLEALGRTIQTAANEGTRVLTPFGRFAPRVRPARLARNPRTGETIEVPERLTVNFKAGKPRS